MVGSATELSILEAEMAARVTTALRRLETLLRGLLRLGQEDRLVATGLDAEATARTLLCLLQGLRVIGKTGRPRTEILAAVEPVLQMLRPRSETLPDG